MDAQMNKMKPVLPELIINEFKFMAPRAKENVSVLKIFLVDGVLRHNLDTTNKLAKVGPVAFQENVVKEGRGKAEDI